VSFAFLFWIYAAGYKKTFWIFFPFVILMNFSRIAGWLHWFFDIFVWMLLWLISVIFIFKNSKNKIIEKINSLLFIIAWFM
jgi:membrane-associated phospholipid phosphatase